MTVRWTVRAANDRSRDRAARLNSCHSDHKENLNCNKIENFIKHLYNNIYLL